MSPSSRGRGLKYTNNLAVCLSVLVALFTRAWIEITWNIYARRKSLVALFTRAWIEMPCMSLPS